MPGTTISEAPSVSLSFANNFWGKDDAGVSPLLERMHNAKVTGDELKAFYTARAQIEDDYARKLLNLARKPLGSSEAGTLRMSLDVIRGEVESMGKAHQTIAGQMKGELEEPLSAFAGGLKERRKIVQNGIEKLLKTKTQQTTTVNKARDKYEQDCLKIKGYLAQGHMVMGQEERKNKAKLEKTQIQLSTTSNEYEAAVKILEETTGRWNREWKAACDKFQDLEEERIDFMKSSLWSFANIASTVCVSDDASCEKVRLSLEDCDVEKDVTNFIKEQGTGQEIPDPPKFINFCKGDINDTASDVSDEGNYSVAQFQRTMNPAFRTSSPQPSTYESHHDPESNLAQEMRQPTQEMRQPTNPLRTSQNQPPAQPQFEEIPKVPHNEYPMDGMTQFCRIGPPSDRSSIPSPTRPESRDHDDKSDYSNPTSFSSYEIPSGHPSPTKQYPDMSGEERPGLQKRKSGFFQNHSPFRRRSKHENQAPSGSVTPSARNAFAASTSSQSGSSPTRPFGRQARNVGFGGNEATTPDPEPVDPRANFQLNVGNNVFDVASPDSRKKPISQRPIDDSDPIAAALAELKGVTKHTSVRVSADRYHGIATPAPSGTPGPGESRAPPRPFAGQELRAAQGRTPPPGYDPPVSRLGAPQPAFTSKQMQQTTASYVNQKRDMYNPGTEPRSSSAMGNRPPTREGRGGPGDMPRAASPAPLRSASPNPYAGGERYSQAPHPRAASPNPYGGAPPGPGYGRSRANTTSPTKPGYGPQGQSPNQIPRARSPQPGYNPNVPRARSPQPGYNPNASRAGSRPPSSRGQEPGGNMAMQLSQGPDAAYGNQRGRGSFNGGMQRPSSQLYGEGPYSAAGGPPNGSAGPVSRDRSHSSAGQRQMSRDGRPIMHFARAMYMYQAAIPEELTFAKGDVLAVLRHQDDGWWECEVAGKNGRPGLAPSNYLQQI